MDEHDEPESDQDYPDVRHRLHAFGAAPLRAGLAADTLARVRGDRRRFGGARLRLISAAAVAGFAAAGVGLAAADVLPAPVQDAAQSTLAKVGVHVPPGHNRFNDPALCPGGPYRNHGAYVRSHKSDPNAGQSPCGKPVQAVGPSGTVKDGDNSADDSGDTGDSGHGPPPWAHGKGKAHEPGNASTAPGKANKPEKPSSTTTTPTSTSSTSTSTDSTTSTSSTTSTTMQP